MSFKSTTPWPTQGANLTTYEGGVPGKSSVRKAVDKVGGTEGIRKAEWADAEGNTYRLSTRNGFPEVVVSKARADATEPTTAPRGFLAHNPESSYAALFSPYSLEVLKADYQTYGHSYTVLPFSSPYNVPTGDTTKWCDVASFVGGALLINGKVLPALTVTGATAGSLPWLIPASGSGVERYGDAVTNATVKRVFSVGRDVTHSWAGVDVQLSGAAFRSDNKALVCGQRVDAVTNKAWMSQLVFTGEFWDELFGGWGFNTTEVSMLLTPPYLAKLDDGPLVDQGLCVPQASLPESGSYTVNTPLPVTELCTIGYGVMGASNFSPTLVTQYRLINFPMSEVYTYAVPGKQNIDYSRVGYSGEYNASGTLVGESYVCHAENTLVFSDNTESYGFDDINVTLSGPQNGVLSYDQGTLDHTSHTASWLVDTMSDPPKTVPRSNCRGSDGYFHQASGIANTALFATKENNGTSFVEVDGVRLVSVTFSRTSTSGEKVVVTPVTGRYAGPLADPYAYIEANHTLNSYGIISALQVQIDDSTPLDINVLGYREPLIEARAATYIGKACYEAYDDEATSTLYSSHVAERAPQETQTLEWSTKDFILYDKPNGVFISVEAYFSGEQNYGDIGTATLSVILKVDTPAGTGEQLMFQREMTYLEMLEEQELQTGVKYVPSPQLRLMFTPLHREQGGFKGAAYTTASEIENGATPSHLFNFVLTLDTFSAIGTDVSSETVTRFIPCNMLEMLYGYVFSSKYGVDDYARYPVDYATRFNSFMATLFANQWRVNYRDGAFIDWLDTLGGAYVTEQTTELYRI